MSDIQKVHLPVALTIAGSDSSGGAGIQADLKTFSALQCYGMSAIIALTAQNTTGVSAIHPAPESFIYEQIRCVTDDIGTDAVKIGMLFNKGTIQTVVDAIKAQNLTNIVTDPVMVSQSGSKLLEDDAIETLVNSLFPLSTIITPNISEANVILKANIKGDPDEMEEAARELGRTGPQAVLLKGGHSESGNAIDYLYYKKKNKVYKFESERIDTPNTHGTGCTLSSAIAAHLARGYNLVEAVEESKSYITGAIKAGSYYKTGKGSGPVHHFFRYW